ncbi:MAG: hypothetical protein MJY85_10120 [Fibrobacter sp.]|nr:hypothetical protein [Fibrobacter sp.]
MYIENMTRSKYIASIALVFTACFCGGCDSNSSTEAGKTFDPECEKNTYKECMKNVEDSILGSIACDIAVEEACYIKE